MRFFVGTFLDLPHQRFYERFIKELIRQHPGMLRSIPENSAHLTYVFCADAPDQSVDAIGGAVKKATDTHRAFEIRLGSPRVMSAGSRPRLVCADVLSGDTQLHRLAADILGALQLACPDLSLSRSRSPHVTLARFRQQARRADSQAVSRSLAGSEGSSISRDAWIAEVQVVASELTPSGPAYGIKAQVPLTTFSR